MWQRLRDFSKRTDLVLAWLAIFLWCTTWFQGYTRLQGFINLMERLPKWDWIGYEPIIQEPAYMIALSILYWGALIGALFILILLIWRLVRSIRGGEDDLSPEAREIRGLSQKMDDLTTEIKGLRQDLKGGKANGGKGSDSKTD